MESKAELPLWLLALTTSDLMTGESMHLVRACDNPECRWLFLDTSKNHTRRWCDMKLCGNRMKARRFKARETY
jgi:predicted RNA-binding Zn ribbon-like protein